MPQWGSVVIQTVSACSAQGIPPPWPKRTEWKCTVMIRIFHGLRQGCVLLLPGTECVRVGCKREKERARRELPESVACCYLRGLVCWTGEWVVLRISSKTMSLNESPKVLYCSIVGKNLQPSKSRRTLVTLTKSCCRLFVCLSAATAVFYVRGGSALIAYTHFHEA